MRNGVASALLVACGLLMAGCGSSADQPDESTSAATSGQTSAGSPSSSAVEELSGNVVGKRLTCVVFVADGGASYALTGKVSNEARKIAGEFGSTLAVTVKGWPVPKAKSTCGLPVFHVDSMSTK